MAEAICIVMDRPSLNGDRGRHTLPAIYSQLLSSRDTSDFSDNWESCDDTEASVHWRRPDVTHQKLRTFEDIALVWTFNKFYHELYILPTGIVGQYLDDNSIHSLGLLICYYTKDDEDYFIGCINNYCSIKTKDNMVYKDYFRDNHTKRWTVRIISWL